MEIWNVAFLEYNTAFRSGFHVPIKNIQSRLDAFPPPDAFSGTRLPYKQIAHWLRVHLGGRRHVDLELLKGQVQTLTEQQWLTALREGPTGACQ